MIMLRIPIAQPPHATRKSETNGSTQWCRRSKANAHVQPRAAVGLYASPTGIHASVMPKIHTITIASHMYGVAVIRYPAGSSVLSSTLRRAARAPSLLPTYQLSTIDGISRPSVYGAACMMIDDTDDGNCMMLVPRSPWKSETQKYQYCFQRGRSRLNDRM